MGLKSGSRSPGFDDDESDDQEQQTESAPPAESHSEPAAADSETATTQSTDAGEGEPARDRTSEEAAPASRPSMDAIPYKLRRDTVNQGRQQVPFFLRESVIADEADLRTTLEDLLDESVYKSDYREAAMVVAQRNPELVAAVLREWGYDLD